MTQSLEDIRREYRVGSLNEEDISSNPFEQFQEWLDAAFRAQLVEPSAMTLATAGSDGAPSARVVLLKGADARGFVFFTNYESKKGKDLVANPKAALLFFWKELERQVRIAGVMERASREESEKYFSTRPRDSQLAAWASHKSEGIANRVILIRAFESARDRFAGGPSQERFGTCVPDRLARWGSDRPVPETCCGTHRPQ